MSIIITIKTKHAVFSWELKISQKNLHFTAFYVRLNQVKWETKK